MVWWLGRRVVAATSQVRILVATYYMLQPPMSITPAECWLCQIFACRRANKHAAAAHTDRWLCQIFACSGTNEHARKSLHANYRHSFREARIALT